MLSYGLMFKKLKFNHNMLRFVVAIFICNYFFIFQLLKQHRNRGVTYSYTIPASKEPNEVIKGEGNKKLTQRDDSSRYKNPPVRRLVSSQVHNRSRSRHGRRQHNGYAPYYAPQPQPPGPQYLSSRRSYSRVIPNKYPQSGYPGRQINPYYLPPGAQEVNSRRRTYYGGGYNDAIPRYQPPAGPRRPLIPPSGAPYTWTVYGFTECTRSCGGGMYNIIISFLLYCTIDIHIYIFWCGRLLD